MDDCIFCKIIAGRIPASKVYEDDRFLAFLDIRPVNRGHVLLIPKVHAERLTDLPDDILAAELPIARRIADAVLAATVFHFGTLRIADVKQTLAAAGHPVR